MLRSLYSGISGMRNFQTKLDVIGNNISNVNTVGFKKNRVTFKDQMYQAISGASAAAQGRGGINPKQIGLGSTVTTVDTLHTQGSTQQTSRDLDLSLRGDGFFVVGSITNGTLVNKDGTNAIGDNKITSGAIDDAMDLSYTRFGRFFLDEDGYLVNADGLYLIGETGQKMMPDDTESADAQAFIDGGLKDFITAVTTLNEGLSKAKDKDEIIDAIDDFVSSIDDFKDALEDANDDFGAGLETQVTNLEKLKTDLEAIDAGDDTVTIDDLLSDVMPLMQVPVESIELAEAAAVAATEPQFSQGLSYQAGLIQIPKSAVSFSIGEDGTVSFVDGLGKLQVAGRLMLASFPNNGGLEKSGDNLYKATANSGSPDADGNGLQLGELGRPGSGVFGKVTPGTLEMSNVDLAEEFSEMIVAQRGFQANTRTITTADEILQELVNLKR
ncbi:flagellar hook-basal body complex protein [Bacillaceae bacterium SIJ1]|uniref:flagellar hook-basal body complex protein n=1 Tax=Litoribacterium kuwaitense TaxID=1398745 RepID=UPI0013EDC84D|nr:flagellar hook-basal body complex protein [Litoribacterium kuwaitense]NGP44121.1 flagellar hook-basal body complex protein [Litoribacterium kuwaitense]